MVQQMKRKLQILEVMLHLQEIHHHLPINQQAKNMVMTVVLMQSASKNKLISMYFEIMVK